MMINLDVATATCVMGVLMVALGLMFQGNWRRGGEVFSPSRHWAMAAILYGSGSLLIAFRAQLPPLFSVVFANTLIMVSITLIHRGIALFVGGKAQDAWYWAASLLVLISFSWFTFAAPNVDARIVIISLMRIPFFVHGMVLLRRSGRSRGEGLLFWVLAAATPWFAIRAGVTGLTDLAIVDFLKAGTFQAFNFLISGVTGVLMVVAQYRLEAERVRADLAAEALRLRQDRDHLEAVVAERTKELTRSNAELEQFAYVTSHDLRQPLRMVTSYLTLLSRKLGSSLDADGQSFIDFAVDGARRMDALIVALLEYSRIGRGNGKPEPVSLDQAMADTLRNLSVVMAETGADIHIAATLPVVEGDRIEFVRLFQNLIGNAIKYVAPDTIPQIRVTCEDEGETWLIRFRDNGIGIPPEDAERVFGVFQRLVGQEQYEGCGIGLAVCRKIVEHLGGNIWEESVPGGGSCFNLRLPKSRNAPLSLAS
ncbi:MAG: hypothetical protein HY055_15360 [Magnetospirillum sp.]|nr:hypothetical protein [Magnetospirillum sp.]